MYRKPEIDKKPSLEAMLKYYKEKEYEIIPFEDTADDDIHKTDYNKKKKAVKQAVLDHGGANITIVENCIEEILGPTGENINTVDFFRKMTPSRNVAAGSDEFTCLESHGEQWRSLNILKRNSFGLYDYGFMPEAHHAKKYLEWLKKIDLQDYLIEHQSQFMKNLLVAYRAMDFIFGHLQNKSISHEYIKTHLLS